MEHGRGVPRAAITVVTSTTGASIGWQAGGQSKAVIYVFNTQEALDKFLNSNGWSVGLMRRWLPARLCKWQH
ncbi:hypothetical protein J4711_14520 [Staphylococcus epidermidis]|nr:hypothetical protein [Staphylococcus epidermidis]